MSIRDRINNQIQIFCKNVRYLREKNKLSLSDMAKIMHVSVPTIIRIEKGDIPEHTQISVVFHVASHFSYHPARLFQPLYDGDPE